MNIEIDGLKKDDTEKTIEFQREYPILFTESAKAFFASHGLNISKSYTKKDLLELGFVMCNVVGDGSVSIVKEIAREETSHLTLLTKQQLDQHKRESLPSGIETSQLSDIEEDMNLFMRQVQMLTLLRELFDPESRSGGNAYHNYLVRFIAELKQYCEENNFFYDANKIIPIETREKWVIDSINTVKVRYSIPDSIRGIPITQFARRGEGNRVFGYPCPCMDCAHVFPANDGIKFFDDGSITGEVGQVRMNVITNHLAGHGICNNLNQDPNIDKDHRYMTLHGYLGIYNRRNLDVEKTDFSRLDHLKVEQEILIELFRKVLTELNLDQVITSTYLVDKTKEMLFIKD